MQVFTSGVWVYWTVPSGKRAVLKSVLVVNGHDTISQGGSVRIGTGFLILSAPAPKSTANIACTIALYAGETLSAFTNGSTSYLSLGGFLFDDPSGKTRVDGEHGELLPGDTEPVPWVPGW